MHSTEFDDQRYEPRFRPVREQIAWRRSGCPMPGSGSLVDVSRGGLSFHAATSRSPSLKTGDEVRIRHAGLGGASARYTGYVVVWSHPDADGGRSVGCTRLTPTPCVISVPIDPHPLAAMNLWESSPRPDQSSQPERRRILQTSPCAAA
jgi:PilZ domain